MDTLSEKRSNLYPPLVIIGIIVYVGIDVLLAKLRPGYSLLHNAESDYGRGPYSWVMDLNFLLRCGFSLALVKALWGRYSKNQGIKKTSFWIIVWAISSGLLAFFADDPYGYPHTWSGLIHLLLAFVAFVAVVIGMIQLSISLSKEKSWKNTSLVLYIITALSILALLLTGGKFSPHKLGGLYEREFLGLVLLWELVVAIKLILINKQKNTNK